MKRRRITKKEKIFSLTKTEKTDGINNYKFVRHYPLLNKRDNQNIGK